jgi:hypothetical protein
MEVKIRVPGGASSFGFFRSHPVLLLLLLTPGIPEYLSSSSAINNVVFNPLLFLLQLTANLGLYGPGALLVHDARVRWKKGWGTVLLLGAAYGILEEGVALSTLFDPKAAPAGSLGVYGHWLGVNWVWAVGTVPFHAIFSISIPILLLGLVLPRNRRQKPLVKQTDQGDYRDTDSRRHHSDGGRLPIVRILDGVADLDSESRIDRAPCLACTPRALAFDRVPREVFSRVHREVGPDWHFLLPSRHPDAALGRGSGPPGRLGFRIRGPRPGPLLGLLGNEGLEGKPERDGRLRIGPALTHRRFRGVGRAYSPVDPSRRRRIRRLLQEALGEIPSAAGSFRTAIDGASLIRARAGDRANPSPEAPKSIGQAIVPCPDE